MNKNTSIERRKLHRRNVSYYLPVIDSNTQKVIGHLMDINTTGLMMDSTVSVPTNLKYNLRLDLMENIAGKGVLEFTAMSKWCRPDKLQPYMFNAGFQITNISPDVLEVVKIIAEKYGKG